MKFVPVAAAAMVGMLLAGPAAAQTRRYAGRPVADVLKALESPPGLRFIFTNERVPQALLVKSEPKGRTALKIAQQILAEHCLALKPYPGGQQVVVPVKAPAGGTPAGGSATAPAGPVRLNTATLEQLDELPGVGPVTAQKILDYRQEHGAFSSLEELDAIPGIGPARIGQLKDVAAP